jgi:hypothetical protein
MVPAWGWNRKPDGTTSEEFQAILSLRKSTLRAAGEDATCALPQEIENRWGWKAHARVLGRDSDGSLKVCVVVEGPRGEVAYSRNYRLVKREPLPWELGPGLRERD